LLVHKSLSFQRMLESGLVGNVGYQIKSSMTKKDN
jgi:hypothetical protein